MSADRRPPGEPDSDDDDGRRRAQLDANARRAAARRRDELPRQPSRDVVVVALGDERWAIETAFVRGVERLEKLTSLPATPEILRGVTTSHGRVVALFDLSRLVLGQAVEIGATARVLMVGDEHERPFGLLVASVETIVAFQVESLMAVDDARLAAPVQRLVRGVTPDGLIVLDGAALLADERLVVDQRDPEASRQEPP